MNKYFKRHIVLFIGIFGIFFNSGLASDETLTLDTFKKIPILENGRIKPLDTFAQNILKQFSGQMKYSGQRAIQWLARVLFNPQQSHKDKVFLITNPEVLDSIGIARLGKARDRYSFAQLRSGLMKLRQLAIRAWGIRDDKKEFIQKEIISLYNKLSIYQQLLNTFKLFLPHPDFVITSPEITKILGLPGNREKFSFFELICKKDRFNKLISAPEEQEDKIQPDLKEQITRLYQRMNKWKQSYYSTILTIFPNNKPQSTEKSWISPWNLLSLSITHKQTLPQELFVLDNIVKSYQEKHQQDFDAGLKKLINYIYKKSKNIRQDAITLEIFYNGLDPFYKTKFFYGFAVLFILLSFVFLRKLFYSLGFILLSLGFVLHLAGIILRVLISRNAPVTNLFETFIFTGLITALLGIILELSKKKNIGILTGGISGFILLMIAGKYAAEGDTIRMLMAVLDSNFWLATHVITIILGYAGIVLSGFLGHIYILQKIFKPANPQKEKLLQSTYQAVYSIQAFGLIFTFLGTILGGIWADQSWGRFWGWDPKENGALVILLCSAILLHAKKAKWIKETGLAIGSIIGVIAVSLAWFGVNLLGVGLHSYGFTSGVARTLFLFIFLELLFLIVTSIFIILKNKEFKLE